MHILSGLTASVINAGVNIPLAGVLDAALTLTANGRYIYPRPTKVLGVTALGPNLTRSRLNAPSLRGLFLPEIYPTIVGSVVPDQPAFTNLLNNGPVLSANEEYTIEVSRAGAGALQCWAAVWAAEKFVPAPPGPTFTAFASAPITLVANQWVAAAMTFDQVLQAGVYDVVGMGVVCPSGFIARLVYPGVSNYRPGVIVDAAYGNKQWEQFWRNGNFGSFGKFYSIAQPQIEIMGVAAGAQTAQVYLDLIKTG